MQSKGKKKVFEGVGESGAGKLAPISYLENLADNAGNIASRTGAVRHRIWNILRHIDENRIPPTSGEVSDDPYVRPSLLPRLGANLHDSDLIIDDIEQALALLEECLLDSGLRVDDSFTD